MTAVLMVLATSTAEDHRSGEAAHSETCGQIRERKAASRERGHPDKERNMAERKKQPATKRARSERMGGREFGNAIEPTQAQMADGNQGLAAGPEKPNRKPARKKAA
jgi:hypothetical protein